MNEIRSHQTADDEPSDGLLEGVRAEQRAYGVNRSGARQAGRGDGRLGCPSVTLL